MQANFPTLCLHWKLIEYNPAAIELENRNVFKDITKYPLIKVQ